MIEYRIRKSEQNWIIERFEPGGEIAKRGRSAGKPKAARWVTVGYYPQLKHAAQRLSDVILGEGDLEITGREILERIEQAEARAMAVVEEALKQQQ
jgi:hypothetical protein